MAERPILFSAPMVLAILAGRKTQTRRVVKRQALEWLASGMFTPDYVADADNRFSPYGYAGDRLWVREAWRFSGWCPAEYSGLGGDGMAADIEFAADKARLTVRHPSFDIDKIHTSGRPSIHMPRWASRIVLEIVEIRIERLSDCSRDDAIAEGVSEYPCSGPDSDAGDTYWSAGGPAPTKLAIARTDPVAAYKALWEVINGDASWAANPWVWVVTFKRVTP